MLWSGGRTPPVQLRLVAGGAEGQGGVFAFPVLAVPVDSSPAQAIPGATAGETALDFVAWAGEELYPHYAGLGQGRDLQGAAGPDSEEDGAEDPVSPADPSDSASATGEAGGGLGWRGAPGRWVQPGRALL